MKRLLLAFLLFILMTDSVKADTFSQPFGSSKYENITVYMPSGGSVSHKFTINGIFGNSLNSFRTDWYPTQDIQGSTGLIENDSSNAGNIYTDPSITRTYSSSGTFYARGEVMTRDYVFQNFRWKETHQWRVVVIVDTTGPNSPGTPNLDSSDDTGKSTTDNITKNKSNLTFSWSASSGDTGIGLKGYQWKVGSGSWIDNGTNRSVSINVSSDGTYTFYVRAIDHYNNPSTPKSLSFTVDSTRPNTPSLSSSNPPYETKDRTPYFDWGGSDNTGGSGIWRYHLLVEYAAGSNQIEEWPVDSHYRTPSSQTLNAGGQGYDWEVWAVDIAGNESSGTGEDRFYINDPVGSVRVFIEPASAVSSGSRWKITQSGYDSGWKASSATLSDVPTGSYIIKFESKSGWTKPADIAITVQEGMSVTRTGTYRRVVNAWWSHVSVQEGTLVTMQAEVEGFSAGDKFTFEVRENDALLGSDPVHGGTMTGNVYSNGGKLYVQVDWTTIWMDDQNGDPEYYFIVSRDGVTGQSPKPNSGNAGELGVTERPKSGKITGFTNIPADFGGSSRTVTVKVKNTGRDRHNLIIVPTAPSGWNLSPGAPNYQQHKVDYGTENATDFTFVITPPSNGDSTGVIHWVLEYDDPLTSNNTQLDSATTAVASHSVGDIRATLVGQEGNSVVGKFYIYSFEPDKLATGNPGTFSNLPTGQTYEIEGRQIGPFGDEEYWGSATSAAIPANGTINVEILRKAPYAETPIRIFQAENNQEVLASEVLAPGTAVYAKVKVRNNESEAKDCAVEFWYRSGTSGNGTKQAEARISVPAGQAEEIRLPDYTIGEGDHYGRLKVKAPYYQGTDIYTDTWGWSDRLFRCSRSVNKPTAAPSTIQLRRLEPGNINRTDMPTLSSGEDIVPGKRYVVEAIFNDDDGADDIQYVTFLLKHPSGGGNLTIDVKPGMQTDMRVWHDSTELDLTNNDYIQKTHIFPAEKISPNQKVFAAMFWLSGKWGGNEDDGVQLLAWAHDDSGNSGEYAIGQSTYGYQPRSLPVGKWTVIVHGKSSVNGGLINALGPGPWSWHSEMTPWFRQQSEPATDDEWMWEMAWKIDQVSSTGTTIHRLDRETMTLQSWHGGRSGGYQTPHLPSSNGHNILLLDWDEASDFVRSVDIITPFDEDGWFAYAAADAMSALIHRDIGFENISSAIGYSRGGVVVSELIRRILLAGNSSQHVILLDAEGWGPYVDDEFHVWAGTRTDQYRSKSGPEWNKILKAGCGGDPLPENDGNDRIVDNWPLYSQVLGGWFDSMLIEIVHSLVSSLELKVSTAQAILELAFKNQDYSHLVPPETMEYIEQRILDKEIGHSYYPHYFAEWCYLEPDGIENSALVTPQIHMDDRGAQSIQYASTFAPSVPDNMEGGVFNGSFEQGSYAGWTYLGGTTPLGKVEMLPGSSAWIGPLGVGNELTHNWLVTPKTVTHLRFTYWTEMLLLFDDMSVGTSKWNDNSGTTTYEMPIYRHWIGNNYRPLTSTRSFAKRGTAGQFTIGTHDVETTTLVYVDDVKFIEASEPSVGALTGTPNPIVQGEGLSLVAGGVFGRDASIDEVHFYHDSNGNEVYDDGTDQPFAVAYTYTGSADNWEIKKTTASIPVGMRYFFARAIDGNGLWSSATRTNLRIEITQPVNQPPVVSALNNSPDPVELGNTVTLEATGVSDPDGTVQRVEFYHDKNNNAVLDNGDALLDTDTSIINDRATATLNTSSLPSGVVRFIAVAFDNEGAKSGEVLCRSSIIKKWILTYQVVPSNGGSISMYPAAGRYTDGTRINPGATALENYRFDHWEANGQQVTLPLYLHSDMSLKAVFVYEEAIISPFLNSIGQQSAETGIPFSLTITKQQGDTPITWSLERSPAGMTIDNSGVISWVSPGPANSNHLVTVRAENLAGVDTKSFTLYVSSSQHILTVNKAGNGSGTLNSLPVGIDCGADCSEIYDSGQVVTLTSTPDEGSYFTGWSVGGCVGSNTCTVTMNADKTITAIFEVEVASHSISDLVPNRAIGGALVTIIGRGFDSGTSVSFGGVAALNVTVVSETEITCIVPTPGQAEGPVDVVANIGGNFVSMIDGFYYLGAPTLDTISPNKGTLNGGTNVTITGTNFFSGASVIFGGYAATEVTVISETEITCTTPVNPLGNVDVVVANADSQSGIKISGYEYVEEDSGGQLIDKIVWVSERSGNHDIWMMNPDGTDKLQLTTDIGSDTSPMISPNGRVIAFNSNRTGESRIYLMNTDGSNQRAISGDNCHYPAWSPDGLKIYFCDYSSGTGLILVMDQDGSNVQSLGIYGNRVVASPDGTKLTYYPPGNSNPNNYDVHIANSDGTGVIDLSDVANLTGYEVPLNKTAWGSTGKILLTAQEPTWRNTTDYDIYWVNADSGATGPLLDEENNYNSSAGWSPDEQKIVFVSERSGNRDIHIMNPDGTNIVQLTTDALEDSTPHWGKIASCNGWTETSSLDTPINSPGAAFVENGYIYSPGGWVIAHGTFHYAPVNTDGSLGTWQATTPMPNRHHTQSSATSYDGAIYLVGGHQPNWWVNRVYYSVPEIDGSISSWSSTTSLPRVKGGSGTFGYNGYLYSTGGTNGYSGGQNALTEVLFAQINSDSSIGNWQATSSLTTGRCFHGATGYNGFAYIVGGEYAGPSRTAVEVLFAPIQNNGEIGTWVETTMLPAEEGDNLVSCKIYAIDGYLYLLKTKGLNYRAQINIDGSLGEWSAWKDISSDEPDGYIGAHVIDVGNKVFYGIGGMTGDGAEASDKVYYRPFCSFEVASLGPITVIPDRAVGGANVTINGSGFTSDASVTFDGVIASGITVVSATELSCIVPLPGHVEGAVDVVVANGDDSVSKGDGFYYLGAPTVGKLDPDGGGIEGGTPVTLTGANFFSGATVTFDGSAATGVTVVSESKVTCTAPAHSEGVVDVIVTNIDSQSGIKANSFAYMPFGIVSPSQMPEQIEIGDSLTLEVVGGSGSYEWTFTGGTATSATGANVVWQAPNNPGTYFISVKDANNPSLRDGGAIIVYPPVHIPNKSSQATTIQSGSDSEVFTVEGGDNTLYTWTISGPEPVSGGIGSSFIFTAPSSNAFAGVYTVTVTDIHGFSDSFNIRVPLKIEPNSFVMRGDASNLPIHLMGAPAGTRFTVSQYDLNRKDVTGESGYGTFQHPTQYSPDEVIPYSPDNGLFGEAVSFNVKFSADDAGLHAANMHEIESGLFRVVPMAPLEGYIEDSAGLGINGATVAIIAPKDYVEQVQATNDGSGNNGYFVFRLPTSGGTYQFIASVDGKVSGTFSSKDLAENSTIILQDAGGSYISGTVTPPGIAKVSVYYNDAEGEPVLAGSTITNETTGSYRIDFDEILEETDFMVRASRKGFCGVVTLSAGLPINNANINLIGTNNPALNIINGDISGIYELGSAGVDIPPGAIDTDNDGDGIPDISSVTASVSTVANQSSNNTMHSGALLYAISIVDDSGNPITVMPKPIIITMPFNLSGFQPGDFESGRFVIRHAATTIDLINGIGIKTVAPEDIISYDAVGDGTQGTVTFRVRSLSTFAVGGTSAPSAPSASAASAAGGGGGGCFIATAAFGHNLEKHVVTLSRFRDKFLHGNYIGEKFIKNYYRYSPDMADYIRKHENVRKAVRWTLIPVTGVAFVALHVHPFILTVGFLSLIAGIFFVARRRTIGKYKRLI